MYNDLPELKWMGKLWGANKKLLDPGKRRNKKGALR